MYIGIATHIKSGSQFFTTEIETRSKARGAALKIALHRGRLENFKIQTKTLESFKLHIEEN